MAGLVGMPEILGRDHAYTLNFASGYGFAGIGIALLGRNHPVGIAFGSLLWAFLEKAKGRWTTSACRGRSRRSCRA